MTPQTSDYPIRLAPLIVTPWYGGTHGGVGVATESLAHMVLATAGDCAVIRLAPDGFVPSVSFGSAGEEIVDLCVRSERMAEGSLRQRAGFHTRSHTAARILRRLVDDHSLRVAHFHFVAFEFDILMRLARKAGLGIVTTFHGADVNDRLKDPAMRPVMKRVVRLSDWITVVSRTLHDQLLDALPEVAPRLTLIPNVVPTSFARAIMPSTIAPRWDVLLVGQLIYRKGGDVLLDALARMVLTMPDVRVAFAGTGSFERSLREQAERLGIAENIDFLGEISRDAVREAYGQTRILAIPSRSEGLPLVLLESQWMGIPAVASAVDGLPEAISHGENGFLVPPENPDALAAAIMRILSNDPLRTQLGSCARERARERFAPEVMARRLAKVYDAAYRDHLLSDERRNIAAKVHVPKPQSLLATPTGTK